MQTSKILVLAALATGSILSVTNSAQAMSFRINSGVVGPNGQADAGAYSEFYKLKDTQTVDFNSGKVPTTGFAQYSFENNSGISGIRADQWAPAGATGQKNTSTYLEVFKGDAVTIKLAKTLNYFGMDWGAVSSVIRSRSTKTTSWCSPSARQTSSTTKRCFMLLGNQMPWISVDKGMAMSTSTPMELRTISTRL